MTILRRACQPIITWMTRPALHSPEDDLRRDYMLRLASSDCCMGEFGAQSFMSVFPKDF
jgi:hypothetical protein